MAYDVVVLGTSVAGLTAARRLALDGFHVAVLDPNEEAVSAAIGHGVAAIGHASTVANMANAYGMDAVREHIRRNVAAMGEIRDTLPEAETLRLRDGSLPGGDERESGEVAHLLTAAGAEARVLVGPDGAKVVSDCIVVDPVAYAQALLTSVSVAGATVRHEVTVTHVTRQQGLTRVWFRANTAWQRDVESVGGIAVIDTLGVSPWGRLARVGAPQWVPVVRGTPARPLRDVTLSSGPMWMVRPVGDQVLVLGRKTTEETIARASDELSDWARKNLRIANFETGRLAIDPSDHGRPIVGASAIPGGFYARGNGRGELANGTASGYYLWQLLTTRRESAVGLPPWSRLRASLLRRL